MSSRRDLRIETLRGLACLLLVAYHAVGDDVRGLRLPDDAWLRWFSDSMVYLRMPLFTFLSGYVYAMRPVSRGQGLPFMRGKVRRLLFPLLCVGFVYLQVQSMVAGVNVAPSSFAFSYLIHPYDHFWYLQALFLIFCFIYLVDASPLGRHIPAMWGLTLACFVFLPHWRFEHNLFAINGALYLLPYFALGVMLRRTPSLSTPQQLGLAWSVTSGLAVVVLAALHQRHMSGGLSWPFSPDVPLGQIYSVATIVFLYSLGCQSVWLSTIGRYSYSIYLFHVFGTAGSRIVFERLGVESPAVLFPLCMLAGVLLPIALEHLLDRNRLTRMLFLGRAMRDRRTHPSSLGGMGS